MTTTSRRAGRYLETLLEDASLDELLHRLEPKQADHRTKLPRSPKITPESVARRWDAILAPSACREELLDQRTAQQMERYERNIENFIGTVKVPIGVVGPLRVNGLFAQGDYFLPLATTEAALVASYHRGSRVITEAGGCAALLLNEGVSRSPGFAFGNLREAGAFVLWAVNEQERFKEVAEATTRYGKLIDMRITVEGNHVYLIFDYQTGDAAGQNMVTIATAAICRHIEANSPVKPRYSVVEANMSGDKKASAQSFMSVRGKKLTAEVTVAAAQIEKVLHTTPERMANYWRMSSMGGVLSGTIGIQGHYANGLAALYLACGQDVACISESAVGVTRFEVTDEGSLYASVTLPNLIVGTVGGGTGLPSQRACLDILGLGGNGKAQAFAEVCAGLALAGELSIAGALCAGHFARAHQRLARGTNGAR
jgi:hydroxymethylglutaryl-CoA reductase (NADPH)